LVVYHIMAPFNSRWYDISRGQKHLCLKEWQSIASPLYFYSKFLWCGLLSWYLAIKYLLQIPTTQFQWLGLGNIAINREYRQISVYNINIACFSFAMLSQRQYLLHCTILIAPKIIVCYCILSRFYGWWILYFLLHKVSFSLLLT